MAERILICGPNWMGDCLMSLPALQMLAEREPGVSPVMLAKRPLRPLWEMRFPADSIVDYANDWRSMRAAARQLRQAGIRRAFVLPNSFRSALVPFMAGIPERIGVRGDWRAWLLTRIVEHPARLSSLHQAWEYVSILGYFDTAANLPLPRLSVPADILARCGRQLETVNPPGGLIGLIPGAARGPSKQWPAEHYAELGRKLIRQTKCRVLVFGTAAEKPLCNLVAGGIGAGALNLAGTTTLPELAAFLSLCRVVAANDSGGMHLAAAVGARVVAIFGMTDPKKTGPLGAGHRVVTPEDVTPARDIARHSAPAERRLREIEPARVAAAVMAAADERREGQGA